MIKFVANKSRSLRHRLVKILSPSLCQHLETKTGTRPMTFFLKRQGLTGLVGAEIGVAKGFNARNMLETLEIKKLYLIDPYTPYVDDYGTHNNLSESYGEARDTLKNFGDYVIFIKLKSEDAVRVIPSALDFVYIDGCHCYDSVKKDVALYYPKVKRGGVLGGHDFTTKSVGVCKAVIEFAEREEVTLHGKDIDWWVIKP